MIMLDVLKAMKIKEDQITKKSIVLVGFSGETKNTLGEIYLPTYVEGVASYKRFGVLDCLSSYNVILGGPWIHNVKNVPSTYHQCIKIQTDWRVTTIKGEHKSTQECYTEALKPSKAVRPKLVSFLKSKFSCFAWSHFDMTEISADIITHKLNIDISSKPVQQKRRKFAPERNTIINEEVDKLLDMGMINEVMYPEWLANVVVVLKKNGKLRVCVDYTDLNKACLKYPFLLPHIDAMVDAIGGHKTLTFMDAVDSIR
ncbi:uncharacterized protein LOC141613521 [Silene latifolia]|uniref:uncharacterized protein LOC141613521 n=1 Tax=Silene latifolia TaxID=37657 RepID=UPI003D76EDF6